MDIQRIMTAAPITVAGDTSVDDALQIMDDHDIRHLPVLEGDKLVGIVSDRDLLAAVGWIPAAGPAEVAERQRQGRPSLVRELMHTALETSGPQDTVVTAAVEFIVRGIGCLPVLEEGRLVGIVTEMDLAMAYWRMCHGRDFPEDVDPTVDDLMTPDVVTIGQDATIEEARERCREIHARHLPIVEDGRLVGIVSDRDLRAAVGSGRSLGTRVGQVMTTSCITLGPHARVSEAAELMVSNKISALPVLHEERLVGLLTLTDLLEHSLCSLREPERFHLA
jgi:CBS domain-containing protein